MSGDIIAAIAAIAVPTLGGAYAYGRAMQKLEDISLELQEHRNAFKLHDAADRAQQKSTEIALNEVSVRLARMGNGSVTGQGVYPMPADRGPEAQG